MPTQIKTLKTRVDIKAGTRLYSKIESGHARLPLVSRSQTTPSVPAEGGAGYTRLSFHPLGQPLIPHIHVLLLNLLFFHCCTIYVHVHVYTYVTHFSYTCCIGGIKADLQYDARSVWVI